MNRQIWQKARKQDGFTLIELIVVVAILGILAAVLTPRVLDAIANARTSAAEASAKQIQLALERYLIAENTYPPEQDMDTRDELVTILADYTPIDPTTIDATTYVYAGFEDAARTDPVDTPDETPVRSYQLDLTFTDGDVVVRITPDAVVVNPANP